MGKTLPTNHYNLLLEIINSNKCFDRRDNTCFLSNRQISDVINQSASKVDRLFRILRDNDLVRYKQVTEHQPINHYRILDPSFLFISYTKTDYWLTLAIYHLDSLAHVKKWRKTCSELDCMIDPRDGTLKPFNWFKTRSKALQYHSFDRCYRKGSSSLLHDLEMENDLTSYDIEWFKKVNENKNHSYL